MSESRSVQAGNSPEVGRQMRRPLVGSLEDALGMFESLSQRPGGHKTGRAFLVENPRVKRQGTVKVEWTPCAIWGVAGCPLLGKERSWMGWSSLLTPNALLSRWPCCSLGNRPKTRSPYLMLPGAPKGSDCCFVVLTTGSAQEKKQSPALTQTYL